MSHTKQRPSSSTRQSEIRSGLLTDQAKLTEFLPEEIWELIFKSHAGTVDIGRVFWASKYFETLLFPKRTQWLFPFVWQLIVSKLIVQKREYAEWLKSLLIMRSVCKTWSQAVDSAVEQLERAPLLNSGNVWDKGFRMFGLYNELDFEITNEVFPGKKGNLTQILKHFKNTHPSTGNRSPVASKTIGIYNTLDGDIPANLRWTECLESLLLTYGKFVKHCEIDFDYSTNFYQFLALMPNLETVLVNYEKSRRNEEFSPSEIAEWSKNVIPRLPRLKFLQVQSKLPNIASDLLKNCTNLRGFVYRCKVIDISGLFASPLDQLRIRVDHETYTILKKMPNPWHLTDLELVFDTGFYKWPEFFEFLHRNWNSSLQRLSIELPETLQLRHAQRIVNWSLMPLLRLAKLTHLTLKMKQPHSLDFLLPVKDTLEYLSLEFEYDLKIWWTLLGMGVTNKLITKQKIKMLELEAYMNMDETNIWKLFPKLQEIRIQVPKKLSQWFGRP